MRTVFAMLALAALVLTGQIRLAEAQTSGPFCFSMAPFTDILVLFLTPNGTNQFVATGRDLATNSGLSATIVITGGTAVLSFSVPSNFISHPFSGTANLSTVTGAGQGICETVNTLGGCGTGVPITMALVICPAGSTSAVPTLSSAETENLMGGTR
jgi:hypothetical protein